jgi:hypothetical protein
VVVERASGRNHRQGHIDYPGKHPPSGGDHNPVPLTCGFYDKQPPDENAVHSLEHGAVWIAYDATHVTGSALDTLKAKVGVPYTVMSPYPGLDQPISLQSWGHQLKLSDANDPRIDQFITSLRINANTHPEPGASCQEQPPLFNQDAPPPFEPAPAPGTPGSQPDETPNAGVTPDAAQQPAG